MPTRFSREQSIAYQMMRGSDGPRGGPIRTASKRIVKQFFERHHRLVSWVEDRLPRIGSMRCSTGVGGVMAKCILYYGKEKGEPMVEAFRTMDFKGANDPLHVLWLWLLKNKKNATESYQMAVTACRAYCEGRTLEGHLRPSSRDIFDWDKTYTKMLPPGNGNATKKKTVKAPKKKPPVTEEQVAREVEEALPNLPAEEVLAETP